MRRLWLVAVPLVIAALVWVAAPSRAVDGGAVTVLPELGTADASTVMMGAAGEQIWAYRRLPQAAAPPAGVELAPPSGNAQQLAFLRYTSATGWQVVETPQDADGRTIRGPDPNRNSARITPSGGGVLVGRGADGVTVLVRKPGGRFTAAPEIPAALLQPADPTPTPTATATPTPSATPTATATATATPTPSATPTPTPTATATATATPTPTPTATPDPNRAETIAENQGTGRIADAAYEQGGTLHALFGVLGRRAEDAVLHYDDGSHSWTREPIELTPDQQDGFDILALSASGSDAWLLGVDGDGKLALFQREDETWKPRSLTLPADATSLPPGSDALTATPDGVWIDAGLPGATDATFFRATSGALTSWCDDGCDHAFGARFSRGQGYRSIGFTGGGRVISNALPAGGGDEDNRGAYLVRQGDEFVRMPGGGGSYHPSAAFSSPTEGWLEGPVQITTGARPDHLQAWPAAARAPLTAAVTAPGQPVGSLDSTALAVGQEGTVLRYTPGAGWVREFLLSSSGAVSKPLLRGVAWPEPERAHAVGDLGAMWMWRAETGLWERDPAAPVGFEGNLMAIAFRPDDPLAGFAVGKEGVLLRYDKTWTQEPLPAGFEDANFTSVAFAGAQALVAAGTDLLTNEGGGWHVDAGARALAGSDGRFISVAGLPDGGAVAAGANFVIERDGPASPWRYATQPLLGVTPVALAAFRSNGVVRALAAVQPQLPYPVPDVLPEVGEDSPPPLIPPFPLPGDGYLLRETDSGWRDEQRTSFAGAGNDRPLKSDPIAALLVDGNGEGWALGGWAGEPDVAGRGNGNRSSQGRADRSRVQTAAVFRYATGAQPANPPALIQTGTDLTAPVARFAIAGHADCAAPCADLRDQSIGPDETLTAAKRMIGTMATQPGGPRLLLYTGGRLEPGQTLTAREAGRYAELLQPGTPTYAAASDADTAGGTSTVFSGAFAGAPAPFGGGAPAAGVSPLPESTPATAGARTHYAFDSAGSGGTVRVIVIDNSRGSLAASDGHQNPPEPQEPWLRATLRDARERGIPAIVVGSRDLNSRFQPSLNVATDGDAVAQLLVEEGASAYFYERPEENRVYPIPSGATATIPSFGTGTLGYRSPLANTLTGADAVFGDAGFLLAEVNVARRDPLTNRAPVVVRLVPVISELTLQAVDGTLVRRSRPSLFQGLGRRARGGDRWGPAVGGGDPQPPGSDPYTQLPAQLCTGATCSTRIEPEYEFTSSDPDIGDFVAQDPLSTNLRKPLLDANEKVVTDHRSGLFCPFNAGTTTVTVKAGGLAYSTQVTVLAGSVMRPCGTRPLDPSRFSPAPPAGAAVPPPAPAPAPAPAVAPIVPPPLPQAPERERPARERPRPQVVVQPEVPIVEDEPVPVPRQTARGAVPGTPPPPAGAFARPIPPGGAVIRVFEEKREEEAAPEQSSAALAYRFADHAPTSLFLYGVIVLAAFTGASVRLGLRSRRERGIAAAAVHVPSRTPYRRRRP